MFKKAFVPQGFEEKLTSKKPTPCGRGLQGSMFSWPAILSYTSPVPMV